MYNWYIVDCDVKQPVLIHSLTQIQECDIYIMCKEYDEILRRSGWTLPFNLINRIIVD